MVEKLITRSRKVIDLARYRMERKADAAIGRAACRHCGAALLDGESEDDCSSAFNFAAADMRRASRKFYAE